MSLSIRKQLIAVSIIVVGLIAIALTVSIPTFVAAHNKTPMRKALTEVLVQEGVPWGIYGQSSTFLIYPNPYGDPIDPATFDPLKVPVAKIKGARGAGPLTGKIRMGLMSHGVDVMGAPGGFVSATHGGAEIEKTVHALRETVRALKADRYLLTRQTFTEFPDLRVAGPDFGASTRLSDANPQQADFAWGRRVLFDFKLKDGKRSQGVLTPPDDYQPGEKRPMIVNFYEKNSQNLHRYQAPSFATGMQEAATLRRRPPFVAVADVPVRAQRLQIERHLARTVLAIDQYRHARRVRRRSSPSATRSSGWGKFPRPRRGPSPTSTRRRCRPSWSSRRAWPRSAAISRCPEPTARSASWPPMTSTR